MLQYDGNQTGMIPGILPGPPTEYKGDYYWWEGGAMMGTYIGASASLAEAREKRLIKDRLLETYGRLELQQGGNGGYASPNR